MSKLKNKKYYALLGIVVLVIGLISLFVFGKIDKYKGQIKLKNVVGKTTSLSASVMNTVENETTSKGSDEIRYSIRYTLERINGVTARDVVINASLNSSEARYARFKEINRDNITSTITNNGKEIEVHIENVLLGEEQNVVLKLEINNAPNGYKVKPSIKIKEETGEETNVLVEEVEVVTNSLSGKVIDKNGLAVSNIELSLNDENGEVKRTYTDDEGNYVFSDIENKTYNVEVEEEIYEKISVEEVGEGLNIKVKEVSPYEIEAHKYITKLDLVINGKEEHYTYNDLEKVVQAVKNAKTISGEITYKISIKNVGEKRGKLSKITDYIDKGLSFNKDKNTGWVEKDGNIYYTLIEGSYLEAKETKEIGLRLDIKNTNEIKTYINEADVNGETYEKVVYILNGKKYREEDVILGEKIEEPEISDETFTGWYTDKNYTNKYKFSNEVTKDLILYGKTHVVTHKVEFYDKNPETEEETKYDEQEVEHGEKVTEPTPEPEHTGYTFECWMDENENIWNFNNPVERDLKLTSCYTKNRYTVLFINEGTEYDRQEIEYKGSIVEPTEPTKQYHSFKYWHLENIDSAYNLNTPVTENITLYSKYERNKHTITFVDKYPSTGEEVGREEVEVNEGEKVTRPEDPSKRGYDFTCWEKANGECYDFSKPVLEDEELTSKYSLIIYVITYNGLTNEEKESLNNPTTYTVEDEITLNNPENRYDQDHDLSEVFIGWTGSNGNDPSIEVKIEKGSIGDKEYTANFIEADPDVYPITYNLKNGELAEGKTNPTSYTKKTATFTLNNPKKTGYDFTGWSGTDLVGQDNIEVTIPKGSRGARSYEAFYTPKNYTIEYVNTCGEVNNPNSYTIETETFTLNNPSKEGYRFTGWKTEEDETKKTTVTIEQGSTGNKKFIATCEPIVYHITYELDGGSLEEGKTNPDTYTIESDDITLNNPSKAHYNFTGWNGTGLDTLTNPVVIPHGSTGDREYTANYKMITHTVTFKDKDPENPVEETTSNYGEPVTVNDGDQVSAPSTNPEHTGYTCDKWSTKLDGDYNEDAFNFNTVISNDLVLYTLCKKNVYTVTFMDGEDQYATSNVPYKEYATAPTPDPTKAHNIFKGWTLNNELFDFENILITGNITLYSSYEEVKAPSISHTPTEWTNQNVDVTVSKNGSLEDETGYTYKYRVEDGSYSDYVNPFEIEENCDVYAVAYKDGVASEETKHEIRNIDKIKPTIDSLEKTSTTGTSATISFSAHDNESGIGEFRIYLDDEYLGALSYSEGLQSKTDSYEISNLTAGRSYFVKLYTVDIAGNISDVSEEEIITDDRIVCQIIGRGGSLYNNDALNEPFSTLRGAITSCGNNQCTIQMLENVSETNEVLNGQDITLDLNGKNVSGVRDYTLDIFGDFILIDSGDTPGLIYNSIDTAIKVEDQASFTMGINEILNPDVSITIPYVYGNAFGVKRLAGAKYNFYDGAVRGEIAISGEVDDAPYMYTPSVTPYSQGDDNYQVATLKIIDDAEARIKSKYYTRVANAVSEATSGYYENLSSDKSIEEQFASSTNEYKFVKDENNYYVNNNTERSTSASTTLTFNMKDEENDKELVIKTNRISDDENENNSEIIFTEYEPGSKDNSSNYTTLYNTIKVPLGEATHNFVLKKGYVYTITFSHYITSTTPENSKMYITDIYAKNIEADSTNTNINKSDITTYSKQYTFIYNEEDKSYTSNNNYVNGSTAFAYFEVDLTNESVNKLLSLRATLDTFGTYDYANVVVKTNNELETSYQSTGLVYMNGRNSNQRNYIGPYTYNRKLTAGKKYYVQMYYFKSSSSPSGNSVYDNYNCKDEFKIDNIRITDFEDYDKTSGDTYTYYFDSSSGLSALSYNSEYGFDTPRNGYLGYSYITYDGYTIDAYLKFDLRNSNIEKKVNLNYSNFNCYNTDVGCKLYAVVTNSPDTPTSDEGAFISRFNSTTSVSTSGTLEPGKENYVHIVYEKPVNMGEPGGNYSTSFVRINSLSVTNGTALDLQNSVITEGEFGFTGTSSISPNNTSSENVGTTAHSYIELDTTGSLIPEYLSLYYNGNANFDIIIDGSKELPSSRDNVVFSKAAGQYGSQSINVNLKPNQKNYVHLLSTNTNSSSLTISSITLYEGDKANLFTDLKKSPNVSKGFTTSYSNPYFSPQSLDNKETADSYVEIDLTGSTKDKIVGMDMELNSSGNTKYVYLSNSKKAVSFDTLGSNREKALLYYSYNIECYYYNNFNENESYTSYANNRKQFYFVLPKGNKYYLHLGAYSNSGSTTYDFIRLYNINYYNVDTDFNTGKLPYFDTTPEPTIVTNPDYTESDGTDDNNFRFFGSNAKNFVSFNDELWRIVGVFNTTDQNGEQEKRLKIVRNESISSEIWDASPESINSGYGINEWSQSDIMKTLNPGYEDNEEDVYKLNRELTQITKYSHTPNINDSGVPSGQYGNNMAENDVVTIEGAEQLTIDVWYSTESTSYDWLAIYPAGVEPNTNNYSQATISNGKLGDGRSNTKPDDSSQYHKTYTVNGDTAQFFFKSDGSVSFYGYYAIITGMGYDENTGEYESLGTDTVNNSLYWTRSSGKCIKGKGNTVKDCDFSSVGIKDSYKPYIDKVKWYTGAFNSDFTSKTVWDLYSAERSNASGKAGVNITDEGFNLDEVDRNSSWYGKVGLLYPSDYVLASGDSTQNSSYTRSVCFESTLTGMINSCISTNNWLFNTGEAIYSITPTNGGFLSIPDKNPYSVITLKGAPFNTLLSSVSTKASVKPAVYLSTKTIISSGTGTSADPYVLELGTEKNTLDNYGLGSSFIVDTGTTITDEESDDYDKIRKERIYSFEYDNETDSFVSTNHGISRSTASSYIEIDLTGEVEDKELSVEYDLSTNSGYGYLLLMEDQFKDISYTNLATGEGVYEGAQYYVKSGINKATRVYTLTHGKKYYLQFVYRKMDASTPNESYRDDLRIKTNIMADTIHTDRIPKFEGRVPVINEEPDTVQILKNISLTNTLEISNIKNMVLDLNGYDITTTSSSNIITNRGMIKIIDSGFDRETEMEELNYVVKQNELNAQKQTYINNYRTAAQEYNDSLTGLDENDYITDGLTANFTSKNYGDQTGKWLDISGNGLSMDIDETYISDEDNSYDTLDRDIYTGGYSRILKVFGESSDNFTYEITVSTFGNDNGFFTDYYSNNLMIDNSRNCVYVNNSNNSSGVKRLLSFYDNKKKTFTLSVENRIARLYVNGELVDSTELNANISKVNDYISLYNSKLLAFRSYNRALTQEEVKANFKVDNTLFDIEQKSEEAPLDYTFTANDLFRARERFYSVPYRFYASLNQDLSYSSEEYVISSRKFPFYTDFSAITGVISTTDLNCTAYVGLSRTSPVTRNDSGTITFNDPNLSLFETYEEISLTSGTETSFKINAPEYGDYYLIIIVHGFSNYTSSSKIKLKDFKFGIIPYEKREITYHGSLTSTTGTVIYNQYGAYLDIEEGIINVNKSDGIGVDNYGTVKLGDHGVINSSTAFGTLIYNRSSGDIMDGTGKFMTGQVRNDSSKDTGFGGYKGENMTLYHNASIETTYNDLNLIGTGNNNSYIENHSSKPLIINDTNTSAVLNKGEAADTTKKTITLNNVTGSSVTNDYGVIEINDSSFGKLTSTNATSSINRSTVNDIEIKSSSQSSETSVTNVVDSSSKFVHGKGFINIKGETVIESFSSEYANSYSYYRAPTVMGTYITIGEDDGVVSTEYPKIKNIIATYALSSNNINFYDGVLEVYPNKGIIGYVVDKPDGYQLTSVQVNDSAEKLYLSNDAVCKIGNQSFTSVQDAIDSVEDDSQTIIQMIKNYNITDMTVIPENRNIILDYNGKNINSYIQIPFENNGILTFDDLSGSPVMNYSKGQYIVNNGTLNINNVIFYIEDLKEALSNNGFITNNGILNVYSGLFKGNESYYIPNIYNTSELNIYGGEFISTSDYINMNPITNTQTGTVIIEGGNFNVKKKSIVGNSGSLTITGGTYGTSTIMFSGSGTTLLEGLDINNKIYSIGSMNGSSTLRINNCNISASPGSSDSSLSATGDVEIKNSSLTFNGNTGIKVSGGNTRIISTNITSGGEAINASSGSVFLSNVVVNSTSNQAVSLSGTANLTFESGSISATPSYTGNPSKAVNNTGTGILTFGVKDGFASKESPRLYGYGYGLQNTNENAIIRIYDGIFIGSTNNSIKGVITELEDGYEIVTETIDGKEAKYLSGDPIIKNITQNIEYGYIQEALDAANDGDEFEILRDYTNLTSASSIIVDKNITIDTKGFKLNQNGLNEPFIVNNGTLLLKDSVGTSMITNSTSMATFKNNGTITINDYTIALNNGGTLIENEEDSTALLTNITSNSNSSYHFISNKGTMIINTSYLSSNYYNTYFDDNNLSFINNTGILTINDGKYSASGYLLDNSGTVTFNGTIGDTYNNNTMTYDNLHVSAYSSYSRYGIRNTGLIEINGGYYSSMGNTINSRTFTFNDGTYVSTIKVSSNSTTNIFGGKLLSENNLIEDNDGGSGSVVNIGVKDGNININSPEMKGVINTGGRVNFYDGNIYNNSYSTKIIPIYSAMLDIEEDSNIIKDLSNNKYYLTKSPIVKNITKNSEYISFDTAIDEASSGDEFELYDYIPILYDSITIPAGLDISLDLNGSSIYSKPTTFIVNGDLTLKNSVASNNKGVIDSDNNSQSSNYSLDINGTVTLKDDVKINEKITLNNSSSILNIEDSSIVRNDVSNSGTINQNGGFVQKGVTNSNNYYLNSGTLSPELFSNSSSSTFRMNGGNLYFNTYTFSYNGSLQDSYLSNSGTVIINDGTIRKATSDNHFGFANNNNMTINGGNFYGSYMVGNNSILTVNSGVYEASNHIFESSSNNTQILGGTYNSGRLIKVDSNKSAKVKNINTEIPIGTVYGYLELENCIFNVTSNSVVLYVMTSGEVKIVENNSLITSGNDKEAILNFGKITLGKNDSTVGITTPVIKGETNGITNSDGGKLYFYDGIVSGKIAAISGTVTQTPTDYSVKITDDGTYKNAILKTTGDIEKVVVVNNINYETIQAAVNSVEDNVETNMVLYTNYTLTDNITVPANKIINFYLNGYTITCGDYAFIGDGTINFVNGVPNNAGGAIYRFLANITGSEINPRDIIIYQMGTGEELNPATDYKLYKLIDNEYKVVKVNENEIGSYEIGNDKEVLRTTTGQISIRGIGEGTYKLVGSDSKELSFNINETSVSNNIRVDRYTSKAKQTVHVLATLILTLQTGVIRHPYVLVLTLIALITIGFITYKNMKREE